MCYNCKTTTIDMSRLEPPTDSVAENTENRKLGLCYDCCGRIHDYDCCELICEPDDVKADHGL